MRLITDANQSLAYCHVPKAASTSWMAAFAKLNKVANYHLLLEADTLHDQLLTSFAVDADRVDHNRTFTFTFLRHPFDRIVSLLSIQRDLKKAKPDHKSSRSNLIR